MDWKTLLSAQRLGEKTSGKVPLSRSAFEQDYDRIIFSHPFRRLQDKTQVHPLPEHDFVHTRLTHSLEVSSVGRSLGKRVGEVIVERHPSLKNYSLFDFGAIVASAALAHDLGNPPFGHAGEQALSDFFRHTPEGQHYKKVVTPIEWEDLIRFEGNAQGFRILNKNQFGLTLTTATLGAFTKYPCAAHIQRRDKNKKSQKKFGFFQSEQNNFVEVASMLKLKKTDECWKRHPLAFLVEAADDICYNIIDMEDGCRLGLISFEQTVDLMANILGNRFDPLKLKRQNSLNEKLGVLRAMVIGQLVDECTQIFLDHEQDILSGAFDQALTEVCPSSDTLTKIADVSLEKIYRARHVMEIEVAGHEALPKLLGEFIRAGFHLTEKSQAGKYETLARLLPADISAAILKDPNPYAVLRLILDFVSGLTDRHALGLFRRIKGY